MIYNPRKIFDGKEYRFETEEEVLAREKAEADAEATYWANVSYDEAVDIEIRKKYTVSQEFAILRQKDEKPEEYAAYYTYCEECKAYVKSKKSWHAT